MAILRADLRQDKPTQGALVSGAKTLGGHEAGGGPRAHQPMSTLITPRSAPIDLTQLIIRGRGSLQRPVLGPDPTPSSSSSSHQRGLNLPLPLFSPVHLSFQVGWPARQRVQGDLRASNGFSPQRTRRSLPVSPAIAPISGALDPADLRFGLVN